MADIDPSADAASPELATTVYSHLRAIAQQQMGGERTGHTLTATALVHEAYLRLNRSPAASVGRATFVHAAAEAMRRILVEHARGRNRIKRGGGAAKLCLDAIGDVADLASEENDGEILALDDAFRRLQELSPRFAEVVRLRFYAGLSIAETAQVLGVSERTVNSDWVYARAWLAREILKDSHV